MVTDSRNQQKQKQQQQFAIALCLYFILVLVVSKLARGSTLSSSSSTSPRLVRLCIASVDPLKLSSQCVMCTRKGFPVNVIDCTGLTRVNDLISTPLSVVQATCLIYNCRREVPDIKPEPYHGSTTVAATHPAAASALSGVGRLRGGADAANQAAAFIHPGMTTLNSINYNQISPTAIRGLVPQSPLQSSVHRPQMGASMYSPYAAYGATGGILQSSSQAVTMAAAAAAAAASRAAQMQPLPYALVPASYTNLLGMRKYKAALVPLFK